MLSSYLICNNLPVSGPVSQEEAPPKHKVQTYMSIRDKLAIAGSCRLILMEGYLASAMSLFNIHSKTISLNYFVEI